MKKLLPVLCVGLAGLTLGLGGCEDVYAPTVRYGIRRDPVLMVPGAQLAPERTEPDRPGQLPLLTVSGIFDPRNPLNQPAENRQEIEKQERLRDPLRLAAADHKKLEDTLEEMFGTPAKPKVRGYDAENKKVVELSAEEQKALKLDEQTLAHGSKHYRIHCVHCHGVPGDGRGPTAQWVNPHPRDFREGLFKFQSVDQIKIGANSPPRRADLLRTLEYGLEGSAMPAFTLLSQDDREALASYVIHLSLRGKAEFDTIKGAFEWDRASGSLKAKTGDDLGADDVGQFLGLVHAMSLKKWLDSQKPENVIQVRSFPFDEANVKLLQESAERGHQLFLGVAPPGATEAQKKEIASAGCKSCHTNYGRESTFRWDDWGTLVKPNNLTNGVYRGGRRPVDFYYRIHSGINGSGMANFGSILMPTKSAEGQVIDPIWDLVNFVRTLPYPSMRAITVQ